MEAVRSARQSLDDEETKVRHLIKCIPLERGATSIVADDSLLKDMMKSYLASTSSKGTHKELLYAFLAHCILLETISVEERARDMAAAHPGLTKIMVKSFLPTIWFAMDNAVSSRNGFRDVDGRIYLDLIKFLIENHTLPIRELIGTSVYDRVQVLWSSFNLPSVDFRAFSKLFPLSPTSPQKPVSVLKPFRLLPFDNDIFNEELSIIQVVGEDEHDVVVDSAPKFNFGAGVMFSDTHHWHNSKAILPKHLGGDDTKPKDEWHRRRMLKAEQRFMSTLQRQAGTLTGALGASLAQIVIPPVGTRANKLKGKGHSALLATNHETVGTPSYNLTDICETIL
jgi:hypothetical protein